MRTIGKAPRFSLAPLAAAVVAALFPFESTASVITVTTSGDDAGVNPPVSFPGTGTGTLRQAIVNANDPAGCAGGATIRFAIPGSGPFVIMPAAPLPVFACPNGITVDGYTGVTGASRHSGPVGFNAVLKVGLDGSGSSASCGLHAGFYGGTVSGLVIRNFFYGAGLCGNVTAKGNAILGNSTGVRLNNGSVIGGASPQDRNLISGNTFFGIDISYGGTIAATIQGNVIGPDASESAAMGNGKGIFFHCNGGTTVTGNVISGNNFDGIYLGSHTSSQITGNKIGVTNYGGPMPNGGNGIHIADTGCSGSNDNNILGNVIAYNAGDGILFDPNSFSNPSGMRDRMTRNLIYANGGKSINLDFYGGPLPNDPGDTDTGPNKRQNYPVISSVAQSGANTTISFTLDSVAGSTYSIELFANSAAGSPGGSTYLGQTNLALTTSPASGSFTYAGVVNFISATATGPTGNTSEFSPLVAVMGAAGASLSSNSMDFGPVTVGSLSDSMSVTITSAGTAPYMINTFASTALCYGGPICNGSDFICSTNCSTSPAGYSFGQQCQLNARFAPNTLGFQSTTIYICDNTSASPRSVTLSGSGSPLLVVPSQWNFRNVLVGSTSVTQTFVISNTRGSSVSVGSVATSGDFTLAFTDCGGTIAPHSSCHADVAFAPLSAGALTGALVLTNGSFGADAGGGMAEMSLVAFGPPLANAFLSGMGIQEARMELPSGLDLGAYILGAPALRRDLVLQNSGNGALTFSSITVDPPFTVVNGCPGTLAAGASCTLTLGFRATTRGDYTGNLNIVSNARGGSGVIALKARAQPVALPLISIQPNSVGFGDRLFATTSPSQRVTISNDGGADAIVTGMTISPDFVITGTSCGPTLAPALTCYADIASRPLAFGGVAGQFLLGSNAASSPNAVNLSGRGCRPFSPQGNRFASRTNCSP